MPFDQIQGQAPAVAALQRMIAGRRVPGAMLFLGPGHVGKRTTALMLAKALNCEADNGDGCGVCPSCRQIEEGVHPDLMVVSPERRFILIDQVRAVGDMLGLISFRAKTRVVILTQAGQMNPEAANALLKTLEEPPAGTLLILCAESKRGLPETIVSRCVPLRFSTLPPEVLSTLLGLSPAPALTPAQHQEPGPGAGNSADRADGAGFSAQAADFGVRFAHGRARPGLAERLENWLTVRDDLIQALGRFDPPGLARLSELAAKLSAGEDWAFVLEWLETWFRDLALLHGGAAPGRLINQDRREQLEKSAQRFRAPAVQACYQRVLATRGAMELNANRALALEALWYDFQRASRR